MSGGVSGDCIVWFAIPLVARHACPDWGRVEQLLNSALAAIFNQTDGNFRVVIAGTDRPRWARDYGSRLTFLHVPAGRIQSWLDAVADAGRKRRAAAAAIARAGGGHVMFVDADDLVSKQIVAHVRASRNPHGYVVERGYVLNRETGELAALPFPSREQGVDFSQICGTSFILFLAPEDVLEGNPSRFDRLTHDGHFGIRAVLDAEGRSPEALDFPAACYVVSSGVRAASDRAAEENQQRLFHKQQLHKGIADNRLDISPDIASEFALAERLVLRQEPQQATSLTVAIATHQRPQGLRRLLTALEPQIVGRPERAVVVVNDGSHDAAYEAVAGEFAHMIRYQALPTNVNIAAARNASVQLAESEFVVFTDDDCLPPRDWLDWLAARMVASPDLDVIAGDVRPLYPEKPKFFAGVQARHGIYPRPTKTDGELRFVTANLAIRRSLFWKLGGFRNFEEFPGAGEDTELSARVSRSSCSRCLDRDWFVQHDIGDGFTRNIRRYFRYGYSNRKLGGTTTSLEMHDNLNMRANKGMLKNFREQFRFHRPVARSASSWRVVQWLSALQASIVLAAYFWGVERASKEKNGKAVSVTPEVR